MGDTTITAPPSSLRVGAVLGRTFELLFRDFVKFVGLSAIVWVPFLVVEGLTAIGDVAGGGGFERSAGLGAAGFLGILLFFASSIFVQAVILYGAFQVMRGQSFAMGQSLKVGLVRFFPVIGLMFIVGIGVIIGSALLVVPGIILYVVWSVAIPVCVVEQKGPFASISRSGELTKGSRWKIFGILLVIWLANSLAQVVISFALAALGSPAVLLLGIFAWFVLAGAYSSISVAVIYHDLRVAKEGVDVDRIVAVFD